MIWRIKTLREQVKMYDSPKKKVPQEQSSLNKNLDKMDLNDYKEVQIRSLNASTLIRDNNNSD